jgi:hypothetical protein
MSIYEILPALDLTQSVHAKISIGMHRVVKFKISRIPHYAYCKYCKQDLSIQHGGRNEHTYTTKQFKSAKSTTYQALQN